MSIVNQHTVSCNYYQLTFDLDRKRNRDYIFFGSLLFLHKQPIAMYIPQGLAYPSISHRTNNHIRCLFHLQKSETINYYQIIQFFLHIIYKITN